MKLTPTKVTDQKRAKPWLVSIPATLSDSGKREKRYFATKAEALGLCDILKARASRGLNYRDLVAMLPAGVTLLDAINFYNEHHYQRQTSVSLSVAWAAYAESRKGHSNGTIREVRQIGAKVLPVLGEVLVCDITLADLESIVGKMPAWSLIKYKRALTTFFNWAGHRSRAWCQSNPAEELEKPRIAKADVRILSNGEVSSILEHSGELLPFWVLCIFCGFRTTEAERAFWSDINWEEAHIRVRQEKGAFTSRFVDLQPNALAWLEPYRGSSGVMVPSSRFHVRRRESILAAGVAPWGNHHKGGSVDRHTFASNHLAHFCEIGSLVEQMGHTNEKMVREKYQRAVTKSAAREFWGIRPIDARLHKFGS